MSRINLREDLNIDKKLEEIWKKRYGNDESILSPIYSEELITESVTFLSLNPSLTPQFREDAKKGYYPNNPYPMVDCSLNEVKYKFYKKFYKIGKKLNSWTAFDLLYERDSTQANLENKYNKKTISKEDEIFLKEQIQLTFEILEKIKPLVVIVSNAYAEKLIHRYINDLDIKQNLPSEENNFIYRLNNIPFITNESKFLGSRRHEYNKEKLNKLDAEIARVLKHINK